MKILSLTIVGALVLLSACQTKPPSTKPLTWATDELDICEAVFRYQFEQDAYWAQKEGNAFFISIAKDEPTSKFLSRFQNCSVPVKLGSEFEIGKGGSLPIEEIKWVNKNKVKVSAGYYAGPLAASGEIYTVVRKNGKWIVEKVKWLWES